MIGMGCDLPGVSLALDPSNGDFEIALFGRRHRLREWTWAERRRLAEAAVVGGRFDGARFLHETLLLLASPPPADDVIAIVGHVALVALGVHSEQRPLPFADAELQLARELGWMPASVGGQPARDIDRLLAALDASRPPAGAPVARSAPEPLPPGWNRIVIDEGEDRT